MPPSSQPFQANRFADNYLLAALSPGSIARLSSHLHPMVFRSGLVLFEPGSEIEAVFFPRSGVISMVLTSKAGIEVEVGLIGPEGVAGAVDALSDQPSSTRGVIQIEGSGWRLPSSVLREEFGQNLELQSLIMRYTRSALTMATQNTLCNRLHSVEQRLAKWLLMAQDRIQSPKLKLTHEFIATMLGSRRAVVTLAAHSLRDAGLIEYRRGFITILDRPGLETVACECYALLQTTASKPA